MALSHRRMPFQGHKPRSSPPPPISPASSATPSPSITCHSNCSRGARSLGLPGHNGEGKTTTTIRRPCAPLPTAARARLASGPRSARRWPGLTAANGVGIETPSLDERLTGRENLRSTASLYDVPKTEVDYRLDVLPCCLDLADRGGIGRRPQQRHGATAGVARAPGRSPFRSFFTSPLPAFTRWPRSHHETVSQMARTEGDTVFLTTHNLVEQNGWRPVGVMANTARPSAALGAHPRPRPPAGANSTAEVQIAPRPGTRHRSAPRRAVKVAHGQRNGLVAVTGAERAATTHRPAGERRRHTTSWPFPQQSWRTRTLPSTARR